MFACESTPLPCGPAFVGLRHSPLNVGLAAGVVAFQQSPFNGPATLALATSGIVGGATLAYFVQAHFNRRILAAPVNITSGNLYHTAVVHPACSLASSSLGSGDVFDNLMCIPFDYGEPGPTCDPLLQMHALELDNLFNKAISSCEAGDAPGTDLIVLPSVPPTSPLSSCTGVGKYIPGDTILYGTSERGISVCHGATCAALDTASDPELSTHFLAISPHVILVFTVFTCLCLVLVLLLITCHMTRISSYFIRRGVRNIPVASPSASGPVNEESEEEENFFFSLPSTPSHLDFASAEAVQINPVEDQNASSLVDAQSMVSESEQEAAAPVEESASEEAHLSNDQGVEENLNEEIISSVELEPIVDEAPVSGTLDPNASPFVPSVLGLPAATTSAALETVDDDIPPVPSAIPTHISARPPGRRRRKHHRKNKNRVVENILVG
ncbi:hypothetical protein NLJ89_g5403 [Agrocybe chaxingu]|uniref:Uncharacterized protein n=1 Tax=Agrocybe chaxingu TaxID=84603 RepID=A0A9W8K1B5_9AGAR|nr:hypothetical protein NLJ89_g5403 [Agrocybe chaxingu]